MSDRSVDLNAQVSTYPLELLMDAIRLAKLSATFPRSDDGRNLTTPDERTFARAAIFTAFNFVESLFIELIQRRVESGLVSQPLKDEIEARIRGRNAKISETIEDWPQRMLGCNLLGFCEFRHFHDLRQLRNALIHARYVPLTNTVPTQDELLQLASAEKAKFAVEFAAHMGRKLYQVFGEKVPMEVARDGSPIR